MFYHAFTFCPYKVAGAGVRFEQYDGLGHSADPKELGDLAGWLKAVIPQEKK